MGTGGKVVGSFVWGGHSGDWGESLADDWGGDRYGDWKMLDQSLGPGRVRKQVFAQQTGALLKTEPEHSEPSLGT